MNEDFEIDGVSQEDLEFMNDTFDEIIKNHLLNTNRNKNNAEKSGESSTIITDEDIRKFNDGD